MKFHAKQALGVLRPRRKAKRRRRPRSKMDELPDAILTHILSQLDDARFVAIAAGVCKRWKECSRHVEVLRFLGRTSGRDAQGWVRLVKRTPGLKELVIESPGHPLDLNRDYLLRLCLIHASPNLEVLDLSINLNLSFRFFDSIASFRKLHTLCLDNTTEPVHFSAGSNEFSCLKKCSLYTFKMMDADLEEFLALCPVLEELEVLDCERFERLVITSNSLRKLRFNSSAGSLQIIAPNLTKLSVGMVDFELICETDLLEELTVADSVQTNFRKPPNLRFLDVGREMWLEDMLVDLLQQARSAKQVVLGGPIPRCRPWAERVFGCLQQVERLELVGDRYKDLLYPETFCFPKLRAAVLSLGYPDEKLAEFIVRSSPALEHLQLYIGDDGGRPYISYFRTLLRLQAAFPALTIDLQASRQTCLAPEW